MSINAGERKNDVMDETKNDSLQFMSCINDFHGDNQGIVVVK